MRGQRVRQCAVTVSSLRAHVSLRSEVAGARGAKASMLPDADSRRMRRELEGVGTGAGNFEQRHERYRALARGAREAGRVLVAFCDGALTADQLVGAYGWLVAVSDGAGGLEVLAAGGGSAGADDCTNVLLTSTRMEALGLAAVHERLGGRGARW